MFMGELADFPREMICLGKVPPRPPHPTPRNHFEERE